MLKLYIILGFKAGLSGGQIYVHNKTEYLKKHGWDVCVIDYVSNQPIYIRELDEFKDNTISALAKKPVMFSKRFQKKCLDLMINMSGWNEKYEQVIIESNTIEFSLWGELLARKLNAKHIAHPIDAFFTDNMREGCMDFLNFKLERKELAGINENSLRDLFANYKEIPKEQQYFLVSPCLNSVTDKPYEKRINFKNYDIVIGSVGRLNKPFVHGMLDGILEFSKIHREKKILLLMVGGDYSGNYGKIEERFSDFENIDVEITGLIYPIPLELIQVMDVNIASGGSAYASVKNNIKTIVVTDTCAEPLGVVGYSVKGKPYADYKAYNHSMCDMLEDVLFNNYCDRFEYEDILPDIDMDKVFAEHMKFIEESNTDREYYPIEKIKINMNIKKKILKFISMFLGLKEYDRIIGFIK